VNDERKAEWLKVLHDGSDYTKPFQLGPYACATNGYRLLAVEGPLAGENSQHKDSTKTTVRGWLDAAPSGVHVLTATLRAFIGGLPPKQRCKECGGRGRIERRGSCDHCGADHDCGYECGCDNGYVSRERNPLRLGPALINGNLLADLLPFIEDESVLVDASAPTEVVKVAGEGWRIFIMPMTHGEGETCPRLDLTTGLEVSVVE
jgi:hypothetical protein